MGWARGYNIAETLERPVSVVLLMKMMPNLDFVQGVLFYSLADFFDLLRFWEDCVPVLYKIPGLLVNYCQ
jgi:hypothetical protein